MRMGVNFHQNRPEDPSEITRRAFLNATGGGLGAVALAWLLQQDAHAEGVATHFAPKAKRVIKVFAAGGVSHVDTFDYKHDLAMHDGKELTGKGQIDPF